MVPDRGARKRILGRLMAYKELGKLDAARRDLEEALRIDPGFEQAKTNLGR